MIQKTYTTFRILYMLLNIVKMILKVRVLSASQNQISSDVLRRYASLSTQELSALSKS